MTTRGLLFVGAAFAALGLAASAADWPQWRGPHRDGVSQETGLLREWPKDGPKLLWQVNDVGSGYSTPAVAGDRLYLLANKGLDNEYVEARRVEDGKPVWTTRVGKVGNPNQRPPYPGARSTPTVDGDRLYALGSDGDLVCLDAATGKERWHKNLRTDFGGQPGQWAYAESPLIDGNALVCTPGGTEATLVALNKNTGDLIWKAAVPGGDQAAYASVIVVEAGGVKQYVQFLAKGVVGVDAKTGKFLWRDDRTAKGSPANIPTPVAHGGAVYTASGLAGSGLVRLKAAGGGVEAEPGYYSRKLPNSIGGSVVVGDYLYGTNATGLLCVEFATGKVKWEDRCVGAGAVCCADGRLYVHGEDDRVALVEATPDAYREKGRFTLPGKPEHAFRFGPGEKAWAYPVVANGRLYLRDLGVLWCYDVKAPAADK
ncbi:MAG TPA: PQQ-binding-like beta-propeller repeat protein [Gemmataceae bacterium]|nr:PQQ-binding-like beta-propeller repeat protein [Gemmataceae bacterium]